MKLYFILCKWHIGFSKRYIYPFVLFDIRMDKGFIYCDAARGDRI